MMRAQGPLFCEGGGWQNPSRRLGDTDEGAGQAFVRSGQLQAVADREGAAFESAKARQVRGHPDGIAEIPSQGAHIVSLGDAQEDAQ